MHRTIGSEKYEKLIQWLKSSRNEKGLTMRDVGAALEVPHSFVQKIEEMERRLDVYEYVQVCEALDIDPAKGLEYLTKR